MQTPGDVTIVSWVREQDLPHFEMHLDSLLVNLEMLHSWVVVLEGLRMEELAGVIARISDFPRWLVKLSSNPNETWAEHFKQFLQIEIGPKILCMAGSDLLDQRAARALRLDEELHGSCTVLYGDETFIDSHTPGVTRPGAWDIDLQLELNLVGDVPILDTAAVRRSMRELDGGGAGLMQELVLDLMHREGTARHLNTTLVHHLLPDAHSERRASAQAKVAESALKRMGWNGTVAPHPLESSILHVRHSLEHIASTSIIIPTRGQAVGHEGDQSMHIEHLVRSIEATVGLDERSQLEVIVVVDEGCNFQTLVALRELTEVRIRFLECSRVEGAFNFARMVNAGSLAAKGEFLVFVNDDVQFITHDWLPDVLGLAARKDVGVVGIKLLFRDGSVQHVGMTVSPHHGGLPFHHNYKGPRDARGMGDVLLCTRETWAVTGAFMAVERRKFMDVGGFSAEFPMNYNDVDLCLKLRALGLRTMIVPFIEAFHAESATRSPGVLPDETERFRVRWALDSATDPFRHPVISWQDFGEPVRL